MISFQELKPVQSLVTGLFFKHKHLLVMLPRQEGKTELGVRLMNSLLSEPVTRSGLFLAKSKAAGKKATREKFMRLFNDKQFKVNTEQVYNLTHPTAVCYMDSVDKQPDKLRGGSYHLVHWSEVAFSEFELGVTVQHVVNRIIKPTQRVTYGYSYIESTPNGKNGWYELWDNAADMGFAKIKLSLSQLVDMGLVTQTEYDKLEKSMCRLEFKQEYECEFVTFEGLVYEEMQSHHVWKEMPSPSPWQKVVMGIDWGWQPSATCILFGYVIDGRMCIFDEIYGQQMRLDEVNLKIKQKLNEWEVTKIAAVADHDPRSNEELTLAGIPCSPAKKADVMGNRLELKTLFHTDKLFIHPRCKMLLKDLSACVWHAKKPGEINEDICTWGHFDGEAALRYLSRELAKVEAHKPIAVPHQHDSLSNLAWAGRKLRG